MAHLEIPEGGGDVVEQRDRGELDQRIECPVRDSRISVRVGEYDGERRT